MDLKANELRTGNLLWCHNALFPENGWQTIIVDAETISEIERESTGHATYKPIPITKKRLDTLGFECSQLDVVPYEMWSYKGFDIWEMTAPEVGTWVVDLIDQCNANERDSEIKYVHEIQNTYFPITKKELPLKLLVS